MPSSPCTPALLGLLRASSWDPQPLAKVHGVPATLQTPFQALGCGGSHNRERFLLGARSAGRESRTYQIALNVTKENQDDMTQVASFESMIQEGPWETGPV